MARLDGYEVNIGDAVYVLGQGSGTVRIVSPDGSIKVQTGRGIMHFADGGFVGTQRRLYWSSPILEDKNHNQILPTKNLKLWRAFQAVAIVLYNQMMALDSQGLIPETE